MRAIALGILLLTTGTAAQAEWLEASSDHFVIYGDQKEAAVQEFAERLETFHAAMARIFKRELSKPSPSNRVTIFVVSNAAEVREVTGAQNRYLAGIYMPRAGGSVAVVPKLRNASKRELSGETVLYHEYAHHFMTASLSSRAFPRWFVEGFAEFFAGVQFRSDGGIAVGTPPYYRAMELMNGGALPMELLLDFEGGDGDTSVIDTWFYGQAWALFHYLQMTPERPGQLDEFVRKLAAGRSALEAAKDAFGNFEKLDKDVRSYLKRRKINAIVLDRGSLKVAAVAVRKLRPGEADMMPIVIESKVGVSDEEAKSLVVEARKIAAGYPDDAAVLAALAEAEFDAGNDDAAIAAADRGLAIDPNQINAHLQRAYALERKVESGALPKESWRDVRTQFGRANRIENDHPIPLVHFYLTYTKQGEKPTRNAIDGLEWALELAPFDESLRWLVAQQMVTDERFKEVAETLAPLAYSPHPGEYTDRARQLLKEVETRQKQAAH
jgi:tetratricopeptide (TPR) repeat protein